jgi:hypothetical protein
MNKSCTRPEALLIFGRPFKVEWPEKIDKDDVGLSDPDGQLIKVKDGLPMEAAQDALLHETMHCVEEAMGMDLKENVIKRLATGLLMVLKDNPHLVSYLTLRKADK